MNQKRNINGRLTPAGLVFFEGHETPRQYVVFHKTTIKGQCDMDVFTTSSLQLSYPFLEKEQCEIFHEDGKWMFRNLSEEGFTFAGGKNITAGEAVELFDGCVIRISNDRMLTAIFMEEFVSGRQWQIINMDDGRHIVEIVDTSLGKTAPALTVQYEDSKWVMQGSGMERILHNGKEETGNVQIRIDDFIQIGNSRFFFEGSGLVYGYADRESGLSINIDERSVHQAMKKVVLLEDINLSIDPGNMVLILGGSGAGKSTFVNAVTGYEKAKATIIEGGVDYYREYKQVKHRIGFVPQDNLMREEDTVGDTIRNAADLRLPREMSSAEKNRRIAAVLETFGLTGRERELVTKLSGGQKKRLSICMEFIAQPSLFILDEPDSGLDGIMAMELMENLRMIACQGKIVMVITHAPDRVAHLFDKVIVLAKETQEKVGKLAFYGGVQEAREFFGTDSLEGVVKKINAENEGGEGKADEFIAKYAEYVKNTDKEPESFFGESVEKDPSEKEPERKKKTHYKNRIEQIPVYLGKQFRFFITEKNWKVIPMAAIIAVLVVYVLGSSMFRNMEYTKYGSLAMVCVCIWNGMFNSIQVVCKERSIIKREHRAGLHISSYLASHVIYQGIICMIQVAVTLVIFKLFGMYFPQTGLLTGSFLLDVGISMFLATFAADMMALMVSCIAHTTTTAMTVMPFLLVVQLVFAGSIFPLNRPMAKNLANFTVSNWGINAINIAADYNSQKSQILYAAIGTLGVDEADGIKADEDKDLLDRIHDVLAIPEVEDKLETFTASKLQEPKFAYTKPNLLKSWGILAVFALIYQMIGLLFLEMIDKDKR